MPSRSPSIDLSGRVAVITGASSGIGAQAARALATAGATVALMARRIERLEAIVGELKASGASAAAYGVDVTDAEALRAAAATIEDELGPASIVVNNAGIMLPTAAKDLDGTDARRQIDLNVAALNAVIAASSTSWSPRPPPEASPISSTPPRSPARSSSPASRRTRRARRTSSTSATTSALSWAARTSA